MSRLINITGKKYNKLTVIGLSHINKDAYWNVKCDCGTKFVALGSNIKNGKTKSCGCLREEKSIEYKLHGNMIGKKFNYLTVIKFSHINNGLLWECICDCGNKVIVSSRDLNSNHTKSCGCLRIKKTITRNTTHNLCKISTYKVWCGMIQRCTNNNSEFYNHYGGRGITVCDKWLKFEGFYEDMGERPKGLTLDRKNVNGNYCKNNCRWATMKQQNNNRRNNVNITYKGRTQTVQQWSEEIGMNANTLHSRINRGKWTIEKALTTKVRICNYLHK